MSNIRHNALGIMHKTPKDAESVSGRSFQVFIFQSDQSIRAETCTQHVLKKGANRILWLLSIPN